MATFKTLDSKQTRTDPAMHQKRVEMRRDIKVCMVEHELGNRDLSLQSGEPLDIQHKRGFLRLQWRSLPIQSLN